MDDLIALQTAQIEALQAELQKKENQLVYAKTILADIYTDLEVLKSKHFTISEITLTTK